MHWSTASDFEITQEIGDRIRRERLNRNLTLEAVAASAGISRLTLQKVEAGHAPSLTSFLGILRALGFLDRLETLLPPPEVGPIELADRQGKARQRASRSTPDPEW